VIRRRFIVALVAALAVATVSYRQRPARAFNFDGFIHGDSAIVAVNPDPRVRWTAYLVGGFGLTSLDTTITLPLGSWLWVPTAVRDSTQTDESS